MVDSRGFSGSDVKNDKHSRPDLLGIIENAISDINAVRKENNNLLLRNLIKFLIFRA